MMRARATSADDIFRYFFFFDARFDIRYCHAALWRCRLPPRSCLRHAITPMLTLLRRYIITSPLLNDIET